MTTPVTRFRRARDDRPWIVNLANALLGWSAGVVPLAAGALVARAVAAVPGTTADDVAFRDELGILCTALAGEATLSFTGRLAARDDTLRLLRTQLRVGQALATHRDRLPPPLPPIFIVGWPRTGTSLLLGLLAQDPAHRFLPYYESFDPVPPADGGDPRPARLRRVLRGLDWLSPHYQSIHAMAPDDPEECVALFMHAFRTLQFDIQYRVPSYVGHLLGTSAAPAYRFYREQLRLVQHGRPGGERWILKDPTHAFALDVILALFPDARIVHTHRDPTAALGSLCSLYAHTRALFSDAVDPTALGPEILDGFWPQALTRVAAVRAAHPALPVVDVRYPDLVDRPLATVAAIYASLGLELTDAARRAMAAYLGAHPQSPRRVHRYSLAQFGLRHAAVRARFADYCARLDLPPEPPAD